MARRRPGKQKALGIEHEPANIRFLEKGIEAVDVAAFRQPETARLAPEHFSIAVAADADLCALRLGEILEEREKSVRCGAGHDLEAAGVLQLAKCPNDVVLESFDVKVARTGEEREVEMRQLEEA